MHSGRRKRAPVVDETQRRALQLSKKPLAINSSAFWYPIECDRPAGGDRLDLGRNTVLGAIGNKRVAAVRNTPAEDRSNPRTVRNSRSAYGANDDGTHHERSESPRGSSH